MRRNYIFSHFLSSVVFLPFSFHPLSFPFLSLLVHLTEFPSKQKKKSHELYFRILFPNFFFLSSSRWIKIYIDRFSTSFKNFSSEKYIPCLMRRFILRRIRSEYLDCIKLKCSWVRFPEFTVEYWLRSFLEMGHFASGKKIFFPRLSLLRFIIFLSGSESDVRRVRRKLFFEMWPSFFHLELLIRSRNPQWRY